MSDAEWTDGLESDGDSLGSDGPFEEDDSDETDSSDNLDDVSGTEPTKSIEPTDNLEVVNGMSEILASPISSTGCFNCISTSNDGIFPGSQSDSECFANETKCVVA